MTLFWKTQIRNTPPGTPISEYLIKKGYDKEKILKAAKNPSDYKRASQGFIPNFAQKIRNGAIYHSKVNNKAVRVKRAHQAEQIAYIKHHGQDHLFESEVPFSDLSAATKEQIQEYLKQKSEGLVPNFAQKIRNGAIYHSKSNNKAVRVKRAHQAEQIAYIKHHGQITCLNLRFHSQI